MSSALRSEPIRILSLALVLLVQAIAANASQSTAADDAAAGHTRDLDEIVASGELIMLTFPHQESIFSRTNLDHGAPMPRLGGYSDFKGVDVDLISAFAESLGVELKIRPVSEPRYSALIPDLLAGRGDVIASSLTITEERLSRIDFSRPYFEVHPVIVTHVDTDLSAGFEELEHHVGVITAGSSHEQRLLRDGIEPATLKRVDFTIEAYAAVLEADADYTLADSLSARRFVSSESHLKVAFRLDGSDQYGVAVPKDSPELLQALNAFLDRAHSNGEIERVLAKHIGEQTVSSSGAGGVQRAAN